MWHNLLFVAYFSKTIAVSHWSTRIMLFINDLFFLFSTTFRSVLICEIICSYDWKVLFHSWPWCAYHSSDFHGMSTQTISFLYFAVSRLCCFYSFEGGHCRRGRYSTLCLPMSEKVKPVSHTSSNGLWELWIRIRHCLRYYDILQQFMVEISVAKKRQCCDFFSFTFLLLDENCI